MEENVSQQKSIKCVLSHKIHAVNLEAHLYNLSSVLTKLKLKESAIIKDINNKNCNKTTHKINFKNFTKTGFFLKKENSLLSHIDFVFVK